LQRLGDNIKGSLKTPGTSLKKLYLTSTGGAGREIFLIQVDEETSVLVLLRKKSDKQIGVNMTIQNPKFAKILDKNLHLILRDLEMGNFLEYSI